MAIKSVLIRNILPPDQIASIIRDRQVAVQNALKYAQQIEQARSKAELTRQEMLAEQNKEKVVAETARIQAVTTGILPIRACHSAGPVSWTELPVESTATVTGMSSTSNS